MCTGFGAEDSYNLYDKPLFTTRESNLFKPSKRQDDEVYAGAGLVEWRGADGQVQRQTEGLLGAEGDAAHAGREELVVWSMSQQLGLMGTIPLA